MTYALSQWDMKAEVLVLSTPKAKDLKAFKHLVDTLERTGEGIV